MEINVKSNGYKYGSFYLPRDTLEYIFWRYEESIQLFMAVFSSFIFGCSFLQNILAEQINNESCSGLTLRQYLTGFRVCSIYFHLSTGTFCLTRLVVLHFCYLSYFICLIVT